MGPRFLLPSEDNVVDEGLWARFASKFRGKMRMVAASGGATLNAYANKLAGRLAGTESPVLLGVHRKGMSILRETLDRLPALKRFPLVTDRRTSAALRRSIEGKTVIVVDDSIHSGTKSAQLVKELGQAGASTVIHMPVVSTNEGEKVVFDVGGTVDPYLSVPLSEFEEVEDKVLIPVVLNLRYGPLSNLMGCCVEIRLSGGSIEDSIVDILEILCKVDGIDFLAETVEATEQVPVFRGDLEFTRDFTDRFFDELRTEDPGFRRPSEVKLRVYFGTGLPLRLNFSAVVHWHTKSPIEAAREIERHASERLFGSVLPAFAGVLVKHGFGVQVGEPAYPGESEHMTVESTARRRNPPTPN